MMRSWLWQRRGGGGGSGGGIGGDGGGGGGEETVWCDEGNSHEAWGWVFP